MKRAEIMANARTQKSDASCINSRRGKSRRAKRQGAKRVRQHLNADLQAAELQEDRPVYCDALPCIVCGKQVKELQHFSNDPAMNWWGGIVEWVTAGYGSIHDCSRFLVCICDECITKKRLATD